MSEMETPRLVCLDMDRVLVDHLSTWQFVYDNLGISNDESFELYNQGLLDEWDWIKLDIALIKESHSMKDSPITDSELRGHMEGMPMMKNWREFIQQLLDDGYHVAIVSGGLQQTARDIAAGRPAVHEAARVCGLPAVAVDVGATPAHVDEGLRPALGAVSQHCAA